MIEDIKLILSVIYHVMHSARTIRQRYVTVSMLMCSRHARHTKKVPKVDQLQSYTFQQEYERHGGGCL